MSMFDDGGEGGEFDGAFRERAAPKIPPRRRRGAAAAGDESQGETAEPAVKKQGGWADEGSSAQQPMGRRRDGGGAATETQAVDAPASSKFDDDDDIPVIPDLEENDEDDITLTVAEPGSISNVVLPTDLKLDTGKLPPPQVEGIDLSMLYECIMPMRQLQGEDGSWEPDVMLEVLKQEMQEERDRREGEAKADNAPDAKNS